MVYDVKRVDKQVVAKARVVFPNGLHKKWSPSTLMLSDHPADSKQA